MCSGCCLSPSTQRNLHVFCVWLLRPLLRTCQIIIPSFHYIIFVKEGCWGAEHFWWTVWNVWEATFALCSLQDSVVAGACITHLPTIRSPPRSRVSWESEWFALEGTLRSSCSNLLPWAGTPSARAGCSKPSLEYLASGGYCSPLCVSVGCRE